MKLHTPPQHAFMHGETYARLSAHYAQTLSQANQFLSKKTTARSGGSASTWRKETLIDRGADCPQCGLKFRGGNHNTEHIHPKSLGGGKSDNANRIQMCKMCNNARASAMAAFIGSAPYSKGFPGNWPRIEAFLLWSETTIDDGLDAGACIPEIHELFLEARFAGERPEWARPRRAFDRFSTWLEVTGPNYSQNAPSSISGYRPSQPVMGHNSRFQQVGYIQTSPTTTFRSMLARKALAFFDSVFDYSPATDRMPPEQVLPSTTDPVDEGDAREPEKRPVDVKATLGKWKSIIETRMCGNNNVLMLGEIWDLVAREKDAHGLAWRAFEREFDLSHRASMPVKATELLQKMDFVFSFHKTEQGFLVIFNQEEE